MMLEPTIRAAAAEHGLPEELVLSMVAVESSGNPFAIRFEQKFYDRYLLNAPMSHRGPCSADTERIMRATSWGLMQVLGQTAREVGFQGHFLSELTDVKKGLHYGCLYLKSRADRYLATHGWEGVIAAYNAGSPRKNSSGVWVNQAYVSKVESGLHSTG